MNVDVQGRMRRLSVMAPSIVQCAVASSLAWVVAKDLLGHERPFFAPIAVVICIGVAVGQRLRRLAEMVVGVSLGVGVGDLLIIQIGSGPWQIALVVALAMGAAVLLDSGSLIVVQAASSAVLVATLLPPTGTGGLDRMVDALLGGALGIAATALLPASPAAIAHRHAAAVLEALASALRGTAEALDASDAELATDTLEEVRGTQKAVDDLDTALKTGREIASIAPTRRRLRRQLLRYETAAEPVDHALRNTRVLTRRAVVALAEGEQPPAAISLTLRELADAVLLFRDELAAGERPSGTREAVTGAAARLRDVPVEGTGLSTGAMTAQLRSVVVDLLLATGLDHETAAASLPPRPRPPG
ncbi:aromatic acid exporter family protein [Planobispora siamensis]|uniref:Integral membrane bound transporter domain-containing protein n=1 Tax=Planobispora siamensis TaxID=936338 RepID=A0A8J3SEN7_9ACTN|nr:FUSC family protein [Planobispora siamensis]GIH92828.1 hypothetical protein Psi01_34580 [Planobispora siamensis]